MPHQQVITSTQVSKFQKKIYAYYQKNARPFPWRETTDPYKILVSEIMLQQTQTSRSVPKYLAFIKRFPDFKSLASAPVSAVLQEWQGLGYNRRALSLQKSAQLVIEKPNGKLPTSVDELDALPGIGYNTACSIAAFAYNTPVVFIETNIRAVFIHEFFPDAKTVSDKRIMPLVKVTLDTKNSRSWYYALMDYGVWLKKTVPNPSRRSKHYAKQSDFMSSNRRVRGLILKTLLQNPLSAHELSTSLDINQKKIDANLFQMQKEGFLLNDGDTFTISNK